MKSNVSQWDFEDAFRSIRPGNFSYDGLKVLYEWLIEFEESIGEEMELDVIAICCDFNESELDDIIENYDIDVSDCEDDDEVSDTVMDHLAYHTSVVGQLDDGSIVYQAF